MAKKIICPKEKLELILVGLNLVKFEELGKEPRIEDAAYISGIIHFASGDKQSKKKVMETYQRNLKRKIEERWYAELISDYGKTREKAVERLRAHIYDCSSCFGNYFSFLAENVFLSIAMDKEILTRQEPKEILEFVQDEINLGLLGLLKQEDETYLELLNQTIKKS